MRPRESKCESICESICDHSCKLKLKLKRKHKIKHKVKCKHKRKLTLRLKMQKSNTNTTVTVIPNANVSQVPEVTKALTARAGALVFPASRTITSLIRTLESEAKASASFAEMAIHFRKVSPLSTTARCYYE